MNPEDAKLGMEVEIYTRGSITKLDNLPGSSEPKIKVAIKNSTEQEVWLDSCDVEPIERKTVQMETWRDIAADAIREGRDAEAMHLVGNKAPGVLPYIRALQHLYELVSSRVIPGLTKEEQWLINEVSRLANAPTPKKGKDSE